MQECGFAGARWAHDGHGFARVDIKGDAGQNWGATEVLGDVFEMQYVCGVIFHASYFTRLAG